MNRFIFAIVVAFFLLNCSAVYAQTDKDLALQKAKQAIKLEDDGKFDEALALLKESQKLDPENIPTLMK